MHECLPERRPVARFALPKSEKNSLCISEVVPKRMKILFYFRKHFVSQNGYISDCLDILKGIR
jgi:hypothetical protein